MNPPSGIKDTNDLNVLRRAEISAIIAQTTPNGDRQINGVVAPKISGKQLYITGDAYIHGLIKTPLNLTSGIRFPDGSASAPSITFVNDPDTGIYRDSSGNVNFTSNGIPMAVIGPTLQTNVPITTPSGQNLVINPDGPSVDFSGKTLINIGGLSTDPNSYEIVGGEILTTNATPVVGLTISTVTNASYNIHVEIVRANVSDNTSAGNHSLYTRGKNIGGVASATTPYIEFENNSDAGVASALANFQVSGSNINVMFVGINATNIKWRAVAKIVRVLF